MTEEIEKVEVEEEQQNLHKILIVEQVNNGYRITTQLIHANSRMVANSDFSIANTKQEVILFAKGFL